MDKKCNHGLDSFSERMYDQLTINNGIIKCKMCGKEHTNIIDFYNDIYPENKIAPEEIESIIEKCKKISEGYKFDHVKDSIKCKHGIGVYGETPSKVIIEIGNGKFKCNLCKKVSDDLYDFYEDIFYETMPSTVMFRTALATLKIAQDKHNTKQE